MDGGAGTDRGEDFRCGPCCSCEGTTNVRNILMMPFEAPPDAHGWGCLECGLPMRGAVAIVCDACLDANRSPRFIAGGKYAQEGVRVPLEGFERRPFDHDLSKHPEVES